MISDTALCSSGLQQGFRRHAILFRLSIDDAQNDAAGVASAADRG
jgi:hypothetical protein